MAKRGGFPGGMPGNMANIMKQAQKMQKQMEEAQKNLDDRNHYRGPDLRRSFPEKHCKRIPGDDRQIFRTVSPHSDDHADPGDVSLFPVEEAALPHLQILGKPRHHR